MFLWSCGREAVLESERAPPLQQRQPASAYETLWTFQQSQLAEPAPQPRWINGGGRRASEPGEYSDAATAKYRHLDLAMRTYDRVAARVGHWHDSSNSPRASSNRSLLPQTSTRTDRERLSDNARGDSHGKTAPVDEMAIPDQHVGIYQFFCQPLRWSPAFAVPGDFTIKLASVFYDHGEVCFQFAVICGSVRAIRDGARVYDAAKRKSYVKHVTRSESELARFTEAMTLRFLGHRLADRLPTRGSFLSMQNKRMLQDYGELTMTFICYLLSITDIGFSRLVALTEPVASHLLVREFFDLSLGLGESTVATSNSCDARIEHQEIARPQLPSAWLDVDTSNSDLTRPSMGFYSPRPGNPRSSLVLSPSDRPFEFPPLTCRSQSDRVRRNPQGPSLPIGKDTRCTRFVPASRWPLEQHEEGAFTVEICSISVVEGRAKYAISVLYNMNGTLEVMHVDRRFSEFDALVQTIEAKVPSLRISHLLPSKTLFRYLSASYLERRAAYLKQFLDKLLRLQFCGLLDQQIPVVAEPNVRTFLELPSVLWSVIPRSGSKKAIDHHRVRLLDYKSFSMSPNAAHHDHSSSMYTTSPMASEASFGADDGGHTPRYHSIGRRRSDSM